ncbi:MAG: DUF2125 domain-containing protein [Alphaproteobacteria bacterium]|nr:DUF2125 domain-containing protein [Alphaproteobacteria bacterium]
MTHDAVPLIDLASGPRPRRWGWLAVVVAVALLLAAGAWTLVWFRLANGVERALAAWVEDRRAEGYFVVLDNPRFDGFPFHLGVRIESPVLALSQKHTLSWRADRVEAAAPVWASHRLSLRVANNSVTYSVAGNSRDIELINDGVAIEVTTNDRGQPQTIAATLRRPRLFVLLLGRPIDASYLEVSVRLPEVLPDDSTPQATLTVAAHDVSSTLPFFHQVDRAMQVARGTAIWRGAWNDPPGRQPLAAWRDAGGTIDLKDLRFEWGPLRLDGDGTLALDRELRPIGAGTITILGLNDFIDVLERLGAVSNRNAIAAKLAFNLLDRGSGKTLIPIAAQNGKLTIGPFTVAEVPSVESFSLDATLKPRRP